MNMGESAPQIPSVGGRIDNGKFCFIPIQWSEYLFALSECV